MTREQKILSLLNRSAFSLPEKAHSRFQRSDLGAPKQPKAPRFLRPFIFSLLAVLFLFAPASLAPQMTATYQPFLDAPQDRICDGTCNCPDCPVFYERLTAQVDPFSKEKLAVLEGFVSGRNSLLPADLSLPPVTLARIASKQDAVYLIGETGNGKNAAFLAAETPAVFVF